MRKNSAEDNNIGGMLKNMRQSFLPSGGSQSHGKRRRQAIVGEVPILHLPILEIFS